MRQLSAQRQASQALARVLNWRYAWFTIGLVSFIIVMTFAERIGTPRAAIGVAFMADTVVVDAGIGFLCRILHGHQQVASEAHGFKRHRRQD